MLCWRMLGPIFTQERLNLLLCLSLVSSLRCFSSEQSLKLFKLGGTEILTPLKTILNQPAEECQRLKQLFVLTDGQVSNSQECIQVVNAERKTTRVFTLGIGSSADRHLVKGRARAGGDTFAFTTEGEHCSLSSCPTSS